MYLHHDVTSLKGAKNVTSSIHSRIRINDLCPYLLIFSINVEHYSSQKWVINDNPLELISSNRVENGSVCPIWRVRHWSTSFSLCCGVEWSNQLDFKHFKLTPPYINIFKTLHGLKINCKENPLASHNYIEFFYWTNTVFYAKLFHYCI